MGNVGRWFLWFGCLAVGLLGADFSRYTVTPPVKKGSAPIAQSSAASGTVKPQGQKRIGVGLLLGSPTGLSLLYPLQNRWQLQGAYAVQGGDKGYTYFHIDSVIPFYAVSGISSGKVPVYYGVGLGHQTGDDGGTALRLPVGVRYLPKGYRYGAFLELGPSMRFSPDTQMGFFAGAGLHFYF